MYDKFEQGGQLFSIIMKCSEISFFCIPLGLLQQIDLLYLVKVVRFLLSIDTW